MSYKDNYEYKEYPKYVDGIVYKTEEEQKAAKKPAKKAAKKEAK